MSPERAAELIFRGLARNSPTIEFPFLLALLSRMGGALPDRMRRWAIAPFRFTVKHNIGHALQSDALPPDHGNHP
jgi:hypothetical protein